LLPYISGNENAALRGGAVMWNRRHISLSAFISSQQLDVSLRDSMAVRLDETGYHRTSTELARRNTQQEQLFGAGMKFNWRNGITAGVLAYRSRYDKNWIRPDLASGYFDFNGRANDVLSLSLAAAAAGWQTHIEAARSSSGGAAGSVVLSGEAPRLRWTVDGHYYDRDFHSLHGRGFNTSADLPQNEFGYSLGLGSRLRRGLLAEIFLSKRRNLWRTSTLPLPGARLMAGVKLEWKIGRDLLLQGRWQQTRSEELVPGGGAPFAEREIILPQSRHSGRLKIEYQASSELRLTTRLDFAKRASEVSRARELGLAMSQELQWKFRNRVVIAGRYAIFETPANAPIYQYEHDLLGVFTNSALRERGRRAYIYVRYLSTFGFDLSCKIVCTERERSIFERDRSWAWGAQIDWRLRR
jgi:hypothetical protein